MPETLSPITRNPVPCYPKPYPLLPETLPLLPETLSPGARNPFPSYPKPYPLVLETLSFDTRNPVPNDKPVCQGGLPALLSLMVQSHPPGRLSKPATSNKTKSCESNEIKSGESNEIESCEWQVGERDDRGARGGPLDGLRS